MEEHVSAWLRELEAGGTSRGTLRIRASHIRCLCRAVDPLTVPGDELVAYMARQSWAPETRRAHRASLRSFFGWLQDRGLRADNPARRLRAVKVPPSKPKPTPELVLAHALALADEEQTLMLMLGAYAGLRRAEIAGLARTDIGQDGLRITGKGGRVRVVPLHPAVRRPLAVWLALATPSLWVFPSPHYGPSRHASVDYVHKRVTAVLQGHTAHTLRHRFGTAVYSASGNDLRTTQELLGHTSPATTAKYVLVDQDRLTAAVSSVA